MPRKWENEEEKREYFRNWWLSEKGQALRRSTVLRRALEAGRFPSKRSIDKYDITKDELQVFVDHMEVQPNQN